MLPSLYNFVPVPSAVYPEWADQVSHDVPLKDGLCGELEVELEAESPLFIRGAEQGQSGPQLPYRRADGTYMLPGTSLRGMLRSVIEIASHGKIGPINDHTFGLRDLHIRHLYGDYMADVQKRNDNNKREPMPLVNAGWLNFDRDENGDPRYYITPCNFARVEYDTVTKFSKALKLQLDPNRRQSAAQKYRAWGDNLTKAFELPIKTLLVPGDLSDRKKLERISEFGEVKGGGVKRAVRFVFTGQPQARRQGDRRKKHHDFVFYGNAGPDIDVSAKQFAAFEQIHSDGAEQHAHEISPNEEWGFWCKHLRSRGEVERETRWQDKRCVPVFFIIKESKDLTREERAIGQPVLRSFGLAMMFRLAYDQSVGELRANTQKNHDAQRRDLAELMFGYVGRDDAESVGDDTLRGRVSISHAEATTQAQLAPPVRAVLSAPKATYYPAYIMQGDKPGQDPKPQQRGRGYQWISYMKSQNPKLRGWKRYLAHNRWETRPPLPEKANEKVITTFQPLKEGVKFRFKIRIHNLKPIELGALIWALDFGGSEGARHLLGMGKPLGYGKVKLQLANHALIANSDLTQSQLTDDVITESLEAFRVYMSQRTNGKWASSHTLTELVACATPHPSGSDPEHLRAPMLNHPRFKNEFAHYKKEGKALPSHSSDPAYRGVISALREREVR